MMFTKKICLKYEETDWKYNKISYTKKTSIGSKESATTTLASRKKKTFKTIIRDEERSRPNDNWTNLPGRYSNYKLDCT